MAFSDASDMANNTNHDLKLMTKSYIPLSMMTDSLSLFHISTEASCTTEKLLMIDLQTVQDFFNKMEIQDLAYIRSEYNTADALTEVKKQSILVNALQTSSFDHLVQQWIVR